MNNYNQPKRPPELQQPEDIVGGGENMNDDNLEESGITTTDLRQAADEALRLFESNGSVVDNTNETESDLIQFDEDMSLVMEIIGSTRMLTLDVKQDLIVGRSDRADHFSAGLDLTDFGAYQLGLSRKHARIRRNGLQLELEDTGSRNGTFVNEQQIDPHVPYIIRNGDFVRFGNMKVQLRFAQKA
jgi:hypothetical protein